MRDKRSFFTIAFILLLMLSFLPMQQAKASDEPVRVFVNGDQVLFTLLPIVEDGNTLVQVRPIYEAIGLKLKWDNDTQTITGIYNEDEIKLTIGSTEAFVDGKAKTLAVAPRIENDSTFVPLRFIAESVGGDITWEEQTNHVNIVTDKSYYVYQAAIKNDIEQVRYWLTHEGGANFANGHDGLTTLSFAMYHNNLDMLELLLQYGADANHETSELGLKPLTSAIYGKKPDIVRLLVDYGADLAVVTRGATPLDDAEELLSTETNAEDKKKLESIISILKQAQERDALLLSDKKQLIPYHIGEKYNVFEGERGAWGYLDEIGHTAIKPRFGFVRPFSEELAFAVSRDGRHVGFIDKTGKLQIPIKLEELSAMPGDFKEGLAAVSSQGKWGYIDKSGAYTIEPVYDRAESFSEGFAPVQIGSKWGVIDRAGKQLVAPQYDMILNYHNGLALVRGKQNGFIDTKGKLVIDFDKLGMSEYGEFIGNYAPVRKDDKVGFIDTSGKWVIPPTYSTAFYFNGGLAPVSLDGKYGYIDLNGRVVIQLTYDLASPFQNGQAFVKLNGKWGVINSKGEFTTEPSYDGITDVMDGHPLAHYPLFSEQANGMLMLKKGDRSFYVLPDGKIVEAVPDAGT